MHALGKTGSVLARDHLLQTPDTFVRTALPGMKRGMAVVHTGPAAGAGFAQYTAELEAGGTLGEAVGQRFMYVLAGEAKIAGAALRPGSFAYCPQGHAASVEARGAAHIAVIEKIYVPGSDSPAPRSFVGHEDEMQAVSLGGDDGVQVRALVPDGMGIDFAINTMTYEPGASLPQVEVHVMEHGCLMLQGGGIYRLSDAWYPVAEGDFIYMAPFCPQWFGALGKAPAKYLIYKDWNRHPLAGRRLR